MKEEATGKDCEETTLHTFILDPDGTRREVPSSFTRKTVYCVFLDVLGTKTATEIRDSAYGNEERFVAHTTQIYTALGVAEKIFNEGELNSYFFSDSMVLFVEDVECVPKLIELAYSVVYHGMFDSLLYKGGYGYGDMIFPSDACCYGDKVVFSPIYGKSLVASYLASEIEVSSVGVFSMNAHESLESLDFAKLDVIEGLESKSTDNKNAIVISPIQAPSSDDCRFREAISHFQGLCDVESYKPIFEIIDTPDRASPTLAGATPGGELDVIRASAIDLSKLMQEHLSGEDLVSARDSMKKDILEDVARRQKGRKYLDGFEKILDYFAKRQK